MSKMFDKQITRQLIEEKNNGFEANNWEITGPPQSLPQKKVLNEKKFGSG